MKDTIVTGKRKKTELITLLACFILANLLNLYAIIAYKTPVIEVLTSLGYVVALSVVLYVVWCIIRLAYRGIKALLHKKEAV